MNIVWKKTHCNGLPSPRSVCEHARRTAALTPRLRIYRNGKHQIIWRIAPSIRECCIKGKSARALTSWWTDIEVRFVELELFGLEDEGLAAGILEAKDSILEGLQDVVPWPSAAAWRAFEREGFKRRSQPLVNRYLKQFGLTWPCTVEELKAAWKPVALRLHPDRGGSQADFIAAKAAYERVLKFIEDSV